MIMSTKAESSFVFTGYTNWRRATVRFKEHELSLAHLDAIKAHQYSQSTSVSSLLSSELEKSRNKKK